MTQQQQEGPIQIPVELVVPFMIHTDEVVEGAQLAPEDEILIEQGFWTRDEAVSFYSYLMTLNALASSRTEFVNTFRAVKESYNRHKSGLLLPPDRGGSSLIIPQ